MPESSTLDELFRIPPPHQRRVGSMSPARDRPKDLTRILGLTVPVAVTLAERNIALESILKITGGTILEFDISADNELSLTVSGQTIATGHAVKIGENFGLRVSKIVSLQDRVNAMSGA